MPSETTSNDCLWKNSDANSGTWITQLTRPLQTKQEALDGALIHAADFGDLADAIALMKRGANPNGYPLIMAIQSPAPAIVEAMLRHGADPNLAYLDTTPLIHAVGRCDARSVAFLLAAGANPNQADAHGMTPMQLAQKMPSRLRKPLSAEAIGLIRDALLAAGAFAADGAAPRVERLGRTCDTSMNRAALLRSTVAVCCYCFAEFPPSDVVHWTDEEPGQTAICPRCDVDAVVGFTGEVDAAWVADAHRRKFE